MLILFYEETFYEEAQEAAIKSLERLCKKGQGRGRSLSPDQLN